MKQRCVSRKKTQISIERSDSECVTIIEITQIFANFYAHVDVECRKFRTHTNSFGFDVINSVETFARGT